MRLLLPFLLVSNVANCVLSARILAVLPTGSKSHHNLFQAALKSLAARGHQVVNYSPFPLIEAEANYTHIFVDIHQGSKYKLIKSLEDLKELMSKTSDIGAKLVWNVSEDNLGRIFKDKNILKLIGSEERFDLIFLEALFGQEVLVAFGHKFKAPVVNMHTFAAFSPVNMVSGNPLSLEYIPDFPFTFSNDMTFYERLRNVYSVASSLRYYYSEYLPSLDAMARSVFKDPSMPPLVEMLHNISLFVNNFHPHVHYSQPYTPNLVPVGGIHLAPGRKPLPQAMKQFLDDSKEGVIYFSLGSLVPDHHLPQQFFDNFINTFRRLPYKVLWKTSIDMANLSGKVLTSKWTPQQDVLAHPNVVLFITHGGMLSQHEAISAGVPVVCIPFLADQPMNAKFYEDREIGFRIDFEQLSEHTIYSAVTKVLSTPKYKDNMARLSRIYQDQQTSPADRLVFWVEYVLRHGGAQHLRPASATLPWYRHYLLDIVMAAFAALLVTLIVLYCLMRTLLSLLLYKLCGFKKQQSVMQVLKPNVKKIN